MFASGAAVVAATPAVPDPEMVVADALKTDVLKEVRTGF